MYNFGVNSSCRGREVLRGTPIFRLSSRGNFNNGIGPIDLQVVLFFFFFWYSKGGLCFFRVLITARSPVVWYVYGGLCTVEGR